MPVAIPAAHPPDMMGIAAANRQASSHGNTLRQDSTTTSSSFALLMYQGVQIKTHRSTSDSS